MKTAVLLLSCLSLLTAQSLRAELKLPAIIGDQMVLQQQQTNPIWGWDKPGTTVKVTFMGQTRSATADDKGAWRVKLDPVPANAKPTTLTVEGSSKKEITGVLVGEVWLCSGQSNMGFAVGNALDSDLEIGTSANPLIRLISVPNLGTQELQDDFFGRWEECGPTNVGTFSAVGYFYGRVLQRVLGVPVGLIDNAWGGSACEAWIHRPVLEKDPRFKSIIETWKKTEAGFSEEAFNKTKAAHAEKVAAWSLARRNAMIKKLPIPPSPPRAPQNPMTGQHRPGNLYAGCLNPIIGYGIKGAIWYQGETNSGRAKEYRELFPAMITHWREVWKQGDFPFYWVQLADYKEELPTPGDSAWAELREAQTLTMKAIKNGGQAVIIDLGEGKDIHPRNKLDVAERLARWALVEHYGQKIAHRSPEFKALKVEGKNAIVTLDTFGASLNTFDVREVLGFAICGEDKVWHWAKATMQGNDSLVVNSDKVASPVAVRYAWSDNPVCNLFATNGLPVTPFRTDDFMMVTDPANAAAAAAVKK